MHYGTCFLCGKEGLLEEHHAFPGPLRPKSDKFGLIVGLCGESCHRNGKRAAHRCRETADEIKQHFQTIYMLENCVSVEQFRRDFDKNRLDTIYYEDERSLPMNLIGLSGRLTQDPILRHTKENTSVASFTIAVKRPGVKDKTDFIECTAWNSNANFICKYFKKGKRIEITGSLIRDDYEKDGEKVKSYKVKVDKVHFGDEKRDEDRENDVSKEPYQSGSGGETFEEIDEDDELPF